MKRSADVIIDPPAAIPGGEVAILLPQSVEARSQEIWFGDRRAHAVAANSKRLLALVPGNTGSGVVELNLKGPSGNAQRGTITVGRKLVDGLHPVANPAFDPADGSLFVTRSGSRGEHVPVSIYRITSEGAVSEFSGDVTNPTAIAFDRKGEMFTTSRFDGSVYRFTALREVIEFATELGIATGLAFRSDGVMFVGDRTGTIFRVDEMGQPKAWAQMEPSVSAYHLAFGPGDALYVTGPTVSSFDGITRFDSQGESSIFYRGLGRPQGLAFDREGNLYVAGSLRGRRGIVRITPDGLDARVVVAGMNVVGLAFGPGGEMVVATNDSVYSVPLEIRGILLE